MELGCGLATKVIHGRRYLYFWRYGRLNGRSLKAERYVSPVGKAKTDEMAVRMLLEHAEDVKAEVDMRIKRYRRALAGMRRR